MNDTPASPFPTGPAATGKATPYRVLARKYRPQNFDDLIGQEPMVRTLTNAFATGRIAQAYMLTGVRGVGKTTTARILARALNYEREGVDAPTIDVRQEGEHCRAIMEGRHVDVIEMDAASHTGIDDIRDIIESVQYAPAIARYKVYIIDEVHMLSRNAFNGLLKTLEEPPEHLKFVFATTEIRKVPVTVLSRCQRFDLRRIDAGTMAAHLAKIAASEQVEIEDDALALVARGAEGSVRDALSILDQAIAHSAGRIEAASVRAMLGLADRARVIDLFEQLMRGDIAAALAELRDQYDIGADPAVVLADLADFVHYVTRLKYVPNPADDVALPETERRRGAEFAASLSVRTLARAWQILLKGIEEVGASERTLAAADMVLVRLAHAASLPAPDELIRMLGEDKAGGSQQTGSGGGAPQADPGGGRGPSAQAATPGFSRPSAQTMPDAGQRPALREAPRMQADRKEAPRAEPAEAPTPAIAPMIALDGFDDLILLAEDKRDIKLKTMLRRNLRLVAFRDGHIEFNLAGDPPKTFMNDLSQKLLQWTGRRWTLVVSREGGMPTLEEQEQAEMGERTEAARADPVVEAILTRFPGSRIVDIKMREAEPGELPPEQAAEEAERREGLDDFLE